MTKTEYYAKVVHVAIFHSFLPFCNAMHVVLSDCTITLGNALDLPDFLPIFLASCFLSELIHRCENYAD